MMSMNLSNIAIKNINDIHYRRIISGISKSKAINLMENKGLTKKSGALPNITIYYDIKNGWGNFKEW